MSGRRRVYIIKADLYICEEAVRVSQGGGKVIISLKTDTKAILYFKGTPLCLQECVVGMWKDIFRETQVFSNAELVQLLRGRVIKRAKKVT